MHWTARLTDAGGGRIQGTISVLALRASSRRPVPAWRLPGGRLLVESRSREGSHRVSEQVWTHAAPPARLSAALHRRLAAAGWRTLPAGKAAGAGHHAWEKGRTRLLVAVAAVGTGSGVIAVLRVAGDAVEVAQ
jgi:hypothetical protein